MERRPQSRLVVTDKGRRWILGGHPWIYRDDLVDSAGPGDGDLVAVDDRNSRLLGWGLYSGRSRIAVRLMARSVGGSVEMPADELLERRLTRAVEARESLGEQTRALRLVHGEADGLPALVVDRYDRVLVVQATTAGAERILEQILGRLLDLTGASAVVARHDLAVRDLEGLPREICVLHGAVEGPVELLDDGLWMPVDLLQGQKTGLYLDQRDNRRLVRGLGPFGRVLDAFCYQGGFGLALAGQAGEVVAVDSSGVALDRGRRAAAMNSIDNMVFERGKVFEDFQVRASRGERFDLVLVDPPAFAKRRGEVRDAVRAYRELNRRAMRLLNPGGLLVTSSCSYNLGEDVFLGLLRSAAARERQAYRLITRGQQASDHPVLLGLPESLYLKTMVLRRVD